MTREEMIVPRIDPGPHCSYGWLAVIIAAGLLCVALTLIAKAEVLSQLRDPLDVAFEQHVEQETKKLCRYEWRGGACMGCIYRVLVCDRGRASS